MAEITWIKLKTDMFDNDKIKLIEALPDKDAIIVIWVKLLTAAGRANCNGYIMLTESIPMNVEEMATIFNRPLNTVRLALETFKRYGMIEVDENEAVCIRNWDVHQNIEGMDKVRKLNAERNKKYRERKKQQALPTPTVPDDVSVTSHDATETDLDKDLDIERDKDKQQTVGQSVSQSVPPFGQLTQFYESNIGILRPVLAEELGYMLDEFTDVDLILEALKRAVMNPEAKNKLRYATGTLKNWHSELITTYQQLHAKEVQTNAGNQRSNAGGNGNQVNMGF